jgi:hypothetical protein
MYTQQINPQRKMFTTTITTTTERDATSKSIASDCRARLPEAKSTCVWTIAPARYLFRHQHVWPKKIAAKYQRGGAHTKKKEKFSHTPEIFPFLLLLLSGIFSIVIWKSSSNEFNFQLLVTAPPPLFFVLFCYPHRPKDNTQRRTIKWIKHWPIKAERQYTRR